MEVRAGERERLSRALGSALASKAHQKPPPPSPWWQAGACFAVIYYLGLHAFFCRVCIQIGWAAEQS